MDNFNDNLVRARPRKYAFAAGLLCLSFGLYLLIRVHGFHSATSGSTKRPTIAASSERTPRLQINSVVQHGHIVEISGSTDPGAIVMINGQTATTIFDDNSFRHFLGPLPSGTTIISVTSQDQQGGVNTQQLAVTIN